MIVLAWRRNECRQFPGENQPAPSEAPIFQGCCGHAWVTTCLPPVSHRGPEMTPISSASSQIRAAQNENMRQQIDTAVTRKQLDHQQLVGDAMNQLLEQSVDWQRQLAAGRIDVRI